MVEVFKTNVSNHTRASGLLEILASRFNEVKFNFDLTDCDNILRAEGTSVSTVSIVEILKCHGFYCKVLE
jgi:hypothetical protein